MSLPLIRSYYGVPAWRWRDITVDGRPCVIIGSATGTMHLRVRFTDGSVASAHPTWRVDYRDRVSTLRRLAYELAHGNRPQLFEGRLHWYSPERAETCGSPLGEYGLSELPDDHEGEHAGAPYTLEPHNLNGPLTDAEVAEWEALEAGE